MQGSGVAQWLARRLSIKRDRGWRLFDFCLSFEFVFVQLFLCLAARLFNFIESQICYQWATLTPLRWNCFFNTPSLWLISPIQLGGVSFSKKSNPKGLFVPFYLNNGHNARKILNVYKCLNRNSNTSKQRTWVQVVWDASCIAGLLFKITIVTMRVKVFISQ